MLLDSHCCASADVRIGAATLAACGARRWLARNAAGVKRVCTEEAPAIGCMRLVCCLPALEDVTLDLEWPLYPADLRCMLEALAWCTRLRALGLSSYNFEQGDEDEAVCCPFPEASVFGNLRSLTKLALHFSNPYALADAVDALVPLTGLAELSIGLPKLSTVPAILGQLKALRSLEFLGLRTHRLEAGCLDLPDLRRLSFHWCKFEEAEVLPGISTLQHLTRIEFSGGQGPRFFDPQLVQLPCVHMAFSYGVFFDGADSIPAPPELFKLPADMGLLSSSLSHLDISGLRVNSFPCALTQLVALEWLQAHENEFAMLNAGITALSRLTELTLGRSHLKKDPLQLCDKRPLDVRALGDLSGFPALRKLIYSFCEVVLCPSMPGAVQHASLTTLWFCHASPAPECAPVVLQLSQALRRSGRGGVLRAIVTETWGPVRDALQKAKGQVPCQEFKAKLEACAP